MSMEMTGIFLWVVNGHTYFYSMDIHEILIGIYIYLLVDTNMGYLQYMGYVWIFIWDMNGMGISLYPLSP